MTFWDEAKDRANSRFSRRSFKQTFLGYLYPMAIINLILGSFLLYLAIPPWAFRPELSSLEKVCAALGCLCLGLLFFYAGLWASRRGPIDLPPADQVFSGFLCLFIGGLMLYLGWNDSSLGAKLFMPAMMLTWSIVIFLRIKKIKKEES